MADGPFHAIHRNIVQAISANEAANFVLGAASCDELLALRGIDAIVAAIYNRRRRNTYMYFLRASLLQQLHYLATGGTAHNGVVDHNHGFALYHAAHGVQLQAHCISTLLLCRLDKGTAHVTVFGETFHKGDAGLKGIADGGGGAAVGCRDNDIRMNIHGFLGQLATHLDTGIINGLIIDYAVVTSKIYIFKNAVSSFFRHLIAPHYTARLGIIAVDDEHFTGLHIAHQLCANQVKGTGFGGYTPAIFHLAQNQRTEAIGITHSNNLIIGHDQNSKSTTNLLYGLSYTLFNSRTCAQSNQGQQHLGINGGGENSALLGQIMTQLASICQIAVVAQGQIATIKINLQRLDIIGHARTSGRITHVADSSEAI